MSGQIKAILYALLVAVFYAVNVPVSKLLLKSVEPAAMAALLYLGAGMGIVATTVIALLLFKESVSKRLWTAITLMCWALCIRSLKMKR